MGCEHSYFQKYFMRMLLFLIMGMSVILSCDNPMRNYYMIMLFCQPKALLSSWIIETFELCYTVNPCKVVYFVWPC